MRRRVRAVAGGCRRRTTDGRNTVKFPRRAGASLAVGVPRILRRLSDRQRAQIACIAGQGPASRPRDARCEQHSRGQVVVPVHAAAVAGSRGPLGVGTCSRTGGHPVRAFQRRRSTAELNTSVPVIRRRQSRSGRVVARVGHPKRAHTALAHITAGADPPLRRRGPRCWAVPGVHPVGPARTTTRTAGGRQVGVAPGAREPYDLGTDLRRDY